MAQIDALSRIIALISSSNFTSIFSRSSKLIHMFIHAPFVKKLIGKKALASWIICLLVTYSCTRIPILSKSRLRSIPLTPLTRNYRPSIEWSHYAPFPSCPVSRSTISHHLLRWVSPSLLHLWLHRLNLDDTTLHASWCTIIRSRSSLITSLSQTLPQTFLK